MNTNFFFANGVPDTLGTQKTPAANVDWLQRCGLVTDIGLVGGRW